MVGTCKRKSDALCYSWSCESNAHAVKKQNIALYYVSIVGYTLAGFLRLFSITRSYDALLLTNLLVFIVYITSYTVVYINVQDGGEADTKAH